MEIFDQYEIWWITGAQLLYGGDAVVKVDAHSKEMVEGLNKSGVLPVKVVYKGTANSSREVSELMKAANNDSSPVTDNYFAANAHAGADMSELAVSMRALV